MMSRLLPQSLILSALSKSSSKTFESYIVTSLFHFVNKLLLLFTDLLRASSLIKILIPLPWKSITIILFVISLAIVPGYDAQQFSFWKYNLAETSTNSQALQIGIVLFLILLILLFVMLLAQYKKKPVTLPFLRIEILLLFFLAAAEISTIFSFNIHNSAVWLIKLLRGLVVYYIFSRLLLERKHIMHIVYAFMFILLFEGVLAGLQFLQGGLLGLPIESQSKIADVRQVLLPISGTSYFRIMGTLPSPSGLANYICLLLPITITYAFSRSLMLRRISYITIVVSFATLILTLSRWGAIASVLTFLLTILLMRRYMSVRLKNLLRAYIFILIPFLILLWLNPVIKERFLEFSLNDASLNVRIPLAIESLYILQNNPILGVGGNNFVHYLVNYDVTEALVSETFPAPVHNFYLLLANETGLLGLMIFSLIFFEVVKNFLKRIRNMENEEKRMAIALFASLVSFLLYGLWEQRTINDHMAILFWMELGILVNLMYFRNRIAP